jgi:hypothetical protein
MNNGQREVYKSIFLEDGWAHQRYFGWKVILDQPGLRVLNKPRAVFNRYLILLTRGGETRLTNAIIGVQRYGKLSDIMIHDFDNLFSEAPELEVCKFQRARKGDRLLNTSTFVVDLTLPVNILWHNLGDKSRNMVRRAEKHGITFSPNVDVDEALARFYKLHARLEAKSGLISPERNLLKCMLCNGSAKLMIGRDSSGSIIIVNIIYLASDKACSFYITSDQNAPSGVGQFIHWKTIEYLKDAGFCWYDLGGVPETNKDEGIYTFKKSIGGIYVNLGEEWYYCGDFVRVARTVATIISKMRMKIN